MCDLPSVCDVEYLKKLDDKYGVLCEFREDVLSAARLLSGDRELLCRAEENVRIIAGTPSAEDCKKQTTLPAWDSGSLLIRFYPLLLLLPHVEIAMDDYRRRGFDEDEIRDLFTSLSRCVRTVTKKEGAPGLNRMYFDWLLIYIKAELFKYGGFNFQSMKYSTPATVFRRKGFDECVILSSGGEFHRSGRPLGSAGCEDEEGSFTAVFTETETEYIGHAAARRGSIVLRDPTVLSKFDWEPVLSTGDQVLSIHIPKGASIAPPDAEPVFREAVKIARLRFPERNIKMLQCRSWLLDPTLRDMLGEESNIVKFGDMFTRFPLKNNGQAVYSFVLPPDCRKKPPAEWPEDNRLFRAVKKRYMDGGFIYSYDGVIVNI